MKKIIQPGMLLVLFELCYITAPAQHVGIGTSNPQSNLHVAGTVRTDSGLTAMPYGDGDALQVKGYRSSQSLDQQNLSGGQYFDTPGPNYQTFTCGRTGTLESVELLSIAPHNPTATVRLHAGLGTGGAVLYDQVIGPSTTSWIKISLPHIPVAAGEKYTLFISDATGLSYDDWDPYAGGFSLKALHDLVFRTFVKVPLELYTGVRVTRGGNLMVSDTLTTGSLQVTGASSFPALSTGTLQVSGSSQVNDLSATGITLSTGGGTPTALNYYEEALYSAPITNGANIYVNNYQVKIVRTGKQVTLLFPTDALSITISGVQDMLFTGLPGRFRPANDTYFPIRVRNTNSDMFGLAVVRSDGNIWLKPGAGASAWSGTNSGFYAFSVSYIVP